MTRAPMVRALTIAPKPTAPQPETSTVSRAVTCMRFIAVKVGPRAQTAIAAWRVVRSSGTFHKR